MGQKSNSITLRKENLNSTSLSTKEFIDSYEFLNTLKRSLDKKGIIITFSTLNTNANTSYLTLNTFFKTHKLMKYRKRKKNYFKQLSIKKKNDKNKDLKKEKKKLLTIKRNVITSLFSKMIKHKILVLNITLLNIHLEKKWLIEFYSEFKKYKNVLFARRFNLFMDFLKLTSLLFMKKINTITFLTILGTIFKILPKKLHGKYFSFLKVLLKFLFTHKKTIFQGIKFVIAGKLKGKLRSSSLQYIFGKVPDQTISTEIDYSKVHVHTMYGCFGLKIWVHYK